jgi:hypothetical protein
MEQQQQQQQHNNKKKKIGNAKNKRWVKYQYKTAL